MLFSNKNILEIIFRIFEKIRITKVPEVAKCQTFGAFGACDEPRDASRRNWWCHSPIHFPTKFISQAAVWSIRRPALSFPCILGILFHR